MKTKVEINGYEIEIELVDGVITVKAEKDDEIIEEFSIETEEGESQEGEEVQGFGEFDEEEDFEGQDLEDEDEFENEDEDEAQDTRALESFQSFLRKNKTK
jgi:hypothetical protein